MQKYVSCFSLFGSSLKSSLPNICGSFQPWEEGIDMGGVVSADTAIGVFYGTIGTSIKGVDITTINNSHTTKKMNFDASQYNSVYGRDTDSAAVVPRSLSTHYYIRYQRWNAGFSWNSKYKRKFSWSYRLLFWCFLFRS